MKGARTKSTLRTGVLLSVLALQLGCSSALKEFVRAAQLDEVVMTGGGYRHVVLSQSGRNSHTRLHIYIGGDGQPWRGGRVPSADPTPHNFLELELLTHDVADAVYVGRPCYFGLAKDLGCTPDTWTFGRFSDDVVASMASVARQLVDSGAYTEVVLIGYSGGGALARLIAPSVPHLVGLLTVAGNLDTAAWSGIHGYLPLIRSRNPADEPPLDASIVQVQAIGGKDEVVPPAVTESYLKGAPQVTVWVYADYDHVCCWLAGWPSILARFEATLAARPTARTE